MAWWAWVLWTVTALLVLVVLYAVALVVRRRTISRHGGTFELSLRRPGHEHGGRGWVLGVGRYADNHLEYFRIFSLSHRPKRVWDRDGLVYRGRRQPVGEEASALYAGHLVATCSTAAGDLELAMSPDSLMGFQSWLEAGAPGVDWNSQRLV